MSLKNSHKIFVKEALKRHEIFEKLNYYLKLLKKIVKNIDSKAEVYLFGSVAEGKHTYSSDIDVLIITRLKPEIFHYRLWKEGIKPPFEIHVQPPENLKIYRRRSKLVKVA